MKTEEKVRILFTLTTRNEAGRHFTELHFEGDLTELEDEGLIEIKRPVHTATGIPYGQEDWSVTVTEEGVALVEAYPEHVA